VKLPVLAVAGAGDHHLAPPSAVRDLLDRFGSVDRRLIEAGRANGFSIDFDHTGLMIGGAAREEIWPSVVDWLMARADANAPVINPLPELRAQ
jgi:poly(3-hydroxyalkanoate) synthetase